MDIKKLLKRKNFKGAAVCVLALVLIVTGTLYLSSAQKVSAADTTATTYLYRCRRVTDPSMLSTDKTYKMILSYGAEMIALRSDVHKSGNKYKHYHSKMYEYYIAMSNIPSTEIQLELDEFYISESTYKENSWWSCHRIDGARMSIWVGDGGLLCTNDKGGTRDSCLKTGGDFRSKEKYWRYDFRNKGFAFQHYDDDGYDEYLGANYFSSNEIDIWCENTSHDPGWANMTHFNMYIIEAVPFTCINGNFVFQSGQVFNIAGHTLQKLGSTITIEPGAIVNITGDFYCNGIINNYGTLIVREGASMMSYALQKDTTNWHGFKCCAINNYGGGRTIATKSKGTMQGEGIFIVEKGGFLMTSAYSDYLQMYGASTFANFGTAVLSYGISCDNYISKSNATIINAGNLGIGLATDPSASACGVRQVKFNGSSYELSTPRNHALSGRMGSSGGTDNFRYVNSGTVAYAGSDAASVKTKFTAANGMGAQKQEEYSSVDKNNVYALSIGTGSQTPGTDVVYIGIRYLGTDGVERSEYLFTKYGALNQSYTRAKNLSGKASNSDTKMNFLKLYDASIAQADIATSFGVSTEEDYLFKTAAPVSKFLGFDILTGDSEWDCKYMSLFEVTSVDGIDMKGYLSSQRYIDYSGTRIFLWSKSSDTNIAKNVLNTFRMTFTKTIKNGASLWTTDSGKADGKGDKLIKNVAMGSSAGNCTVTGEPYRRNKTETKAIIINMSSAAGAGINGFVQNYDSCISLNGQKAKDTSGNSVNNPNAKDDYGIGRYKECLTLKVSYRNVNNLKTTFYVPVMYSTLAYLCNEKNFGDKFIYGIGQAGDSLAFNVALPGFDSDIEFELYYGTDFATNNCGLSYGTAKTHYSVNENDAINIIGLQLYDGDNLPTYSINATDMRLDVTSNGAPSYYYTASTKTGSKIMYDNTGTVKLELKNLLQKYVETEQPSLTPRSSGDVYLVELVAEYPTMKRTTLTFGYTQKNGKSATTTTYCLQDEVESYYGLWSAKDGGAYELTAIPNGKMYFLIEAKTADKFDYAIVRVEGNKGEDPLQIVGLKIYKLESGSSASGDNGSGNTAYSFDKTKKIEANGCYSYWDIKRTVRKSMACVEYGNVAFCDSGAQIQISFSECATEIVSDADVDWNEYSKYMSYSSTDQDMGYTKVRKVYTVSVKVAADIESATSDSGSKNQFYFQLVFAGGQTTGYVLANQQLMSDGFRSGRLETFKIYSNYDYGDIDTINIIPDDQQDSSDVYDKLCVEYITVSLETNSGIARTWRCDINDWIGIDYTDSAAQGTLSGQPGRSAAEVARSYAVNKKGYDVLLVVEFETGDYKFVNDKGQEMSALPIQCSLNYEVAYTNQNGAYCVAEGDAAKAMYEYMDYSAKKGKRLDTLEDVVVIDSHNMMKENSTNRFIVSLDNPMTINSISLTAYGDQQAAYYWKLGKVKIYRITGGTGAIYIDGTGTYTRRYDMTLLSESTHNGYLQTIIDVDGNNQTLKAEFKIDEDNVIAVDEDTGKWNSITGKMPDSTRDTLKVFLYMDPEDDKAYTTYDMQMTMTYSFVTSSGLSNQIANKTVPQMKRGGDSTFYTELSTSGLDHLMSVSLTPTALNGNTPLPQNNLVHAKYMTIVRERSGVIVEIKYVNINDTTNLCGLTNETRKMSNFSSEHPLGKTFAQSVLLSIGDRGSGNIALTREGGVYNDIGISIKYTLNGDPTHKTYYSPNYFLSEITSVNGVSRAIKAHEQFTIPFAQSDLATIEGVMVFAQGELANADLNTGIDNRVNIDGIMVYTSETKNGQTTSVNYVGDDLSGVSQCTITDTPAMQGLNNKHNQGFATIAIKTAANNAGFANPGCTTPIWAKLSYVTPNGTVKTKVMEDLNTYVQSGSFNPGDTAIIKLPLYDYMSVHSLAIEPYDDAATTSTWAVESIDISVQKEDGTTVALPTKLVNKLFAEVQDELSNGGTRGSKASSVNIADVNFSIPTSYRHLALSLMMTAQEKQIALSKDDAAERRALVDAMYSKLTNGSRNTIGTKTYETTDIGADGSVQTLQVSCGTEVQFVASAGTQDVLISDEDKFIKGSFEDITVHLYLVDATDPTLKSDVTDDFLMDGTLSFTYGTNNVIKGVTLKALNDSGSAKAKYIVEFVSTEFEDMKIAIPVTVDENIYQLIEDEKGVLVAQQLAQQQAQEQAEQELIQEGSDDSSSEPAVIGGEEEETVPEA